MKNVAYSLVAYVIFSRLGGRGYIRAPLSAVYAVPYSSALTGHLINESIDSRLNGYLFACFGVGLRCGGFLIAYGPVPFGRCKGSFRHCGVAVSPVACCIKPAKSVFVRYPLSVGGLACFLVYGDYSKYALTEVGVFYCRLALCMVFQNDIVAGGDLYILTGRVNIAVPDNKVIAALPEVIHKCKSCKGLVAA